MTHTLHTDHTDHTYIHTYIHTHIHSECKPPTSRSCRMKMNFWKIRSSKKARRVSHTGCVTSVYECMYVCVCVYILKRSGQAREQEECRRQGAYSCMSDSVCVYMYIFLSLGMYTYGVCTLSKKQQRNILMCQQRAIACIYMRTCVCAYITSRFP